MPQQKPAGFIPDGFEPDDAPAPQPATAAPERTWGDTALEVGKGIVKGAARTVTGLGEMAGSIPVPSYNPNVRNVRQAVDTMYGQQGLSKQSFQAADEATTATNTPQMVGKGLEMVAELAPSAIGIARGAVGLARAGAARYGPSMTRALTSETPLLTQARQVAARKILGRVLEMATGKPPAVNAGGRLVKGVGKNVDTALADALEELRAPQAARSVELPPQVELPPGYTPRSSAPSLSTAPVPAPTAPSTNAGGRLAPAAPAKSLDRELSDVLKELQRPAKPTLITTPPAAELPPGYTPRTTAGPKRSYFLKPEAAATPAPAPALREAVPAGMEDLPASWRSRVGDVAPTQGIKGDDLAKAFTDELATRGVSAKDAILMVSKNPNLPPGVRLQLISALKKAGGIK